MSVENAQDKRRLRRPLHPLVRWRILTVPSVRRKGNRGFCGKTAFSDFFWIPPCLPSDVRYTQGMTRTSEPRQTPSEEIGR
jgi:hypothetical protein